MKEELEIKLAEEFSFMHRRNSLDYQHESGRIFDLYGAFGCACGDGWYKLLHDLCIDITAVYERAGVPVNIIIDQVKEKFGELRFYYHHEDHNHLFHSFDEFGEFNQRTEPSDTDIHKKIADIVDKWENESRCICERCGSPGTLRNDSLCVLTLCDTCYVARNETK